MEPFPRMKVMKLYYLILETLKELPEEYSYKLVIEENTRFRMRVVDENLSIRAIEEKIGAGLIEELIYQAHNEVKMLRILKDWKPWEFLNTEEEHAKYQTDIGHLVRSGWDKNPFEFNGKWTRPERPQTASVHPEEQK